MRVHRLVLMAFNITRPEGKDEVDHIDSNPLNNKLSNLQWANRQMQVDNVNSKVKKTIKIKVIYNNEEKIYDGIKALAKEIKITINKIYKCIADKTSFKGYKFEILDDDNMRTEKCKERIDKLKAQPIIINLNLSLKQKNILENGKKSIIAIKSININTNIEKQYRSINQLYKEIKLHRTKIIKYAESGEIYNNHKFEII